MCSTNTALSWHKNVERLIKFCGQKIPQTVKGCVLPHPTLSYFMLISFLFNYQAQGNSYYRLHCVLLKPANSKYLWELAAMLDIC